MNAGLKNTLVLALKGAAWILLMFMFLLTALFGGWILLAVVFVGGVTQSQPFPVYLIQTALLAITISLAWAVARYIAFPRTVFLMLGITFTLLSIVGVTWMLSSPQEALFLARDLGWDGADILQVRLFPTRIVMNSQSVSHFAPNPQPQSLTSVEYKQDGKLYQANLDGLLQSTKSTSFIIVKDNVLLYEGYFNGYARDSVVTSFSIAKSFASALVGIAVDEGYIESIDDPIIDYLPELRGKGFDGVTVRHLLNMSTGIRYVHGHELPALLRPFPISDDSWTTDYPDLRHLALSVKPSDESPGSAFKYNNYCPQLLGLILERATHRTVSQYLQEKIWQPLEMEYSATWSLDSQQSGFEKMEQGINARAIDFARFGVLFLNNGSWNGKQIIPERWVSESTSPDPYDSRPWLVAQEWKQRNGYYKYMWWGRIRADGSYSYLARGGTNQQWIFVSPRDHVVIVHFGLLDKGGVDSWPDIFENLMTKMK